MPLPATKMSNHYVSVYEDDGKCGKSRIRQDKVVVIVSVSAIFISILVLAMNCLMFFQGSAQTVDVLLNSGPIVCLPCLKLARSSIDNPCTDSSFKKLSCKNDDGIQKCCAYNGEQFSTLLELVLEKQEAVPATLPEYNPSSFTFSPVSAHKKLYPPDTDKNFTDTVPYFDEYSLVKTHFQEENDPLVEHIRKVKIHELGLQILYTGWYFVYSSIHYRPRSGRPCKDFKYQTWQHFVEKVVINYPGRSGPLMKTSHTCCDQCTDDSETSFTGGVFNLTAGDIIRVSVAGFGLIQFQKESSFAGLMMLGSDGVDNGVVSEHKSFYG